MKTINLHFYQFLVLFLALIVLPNKSSGQLQEIIPFEPIYQDSDLMVTPEVMATNAVDNLLTIEDISPELSLDNRKPLFLIHGWSFEGVPAPPGGAFWDNFKNYLMSDEQLRNSFKPYLVKYWSNSVSVSEIAAELRKKVEEAGLNEKKIVIVGHSMGGLVSRSYMNEQQFTKGTATGRKCGEMVDLLITLSSPHHGSPMANGPARDAAAKSVYKSFLIILDPFVFSETKYNEVNRSDLRWDNYDNLLDYVKYPSEKNQWLVNLNSNTQFDSKTICYTAAVNGEFVIPNAGNIQEAYSLGSYLMKQCFGFANDGIVPVKSSSFEGHSVKRVRNFSNYNHAEIILGKTNREELFGPIESDLMEVAPIQLLWPTAQNEYVKYSQTRNIIWNAPAAVSKVNIYFSSNNGDSFSLIAANVQASLGQYNWLVPDINSSNCLIKITDASSETEYDSSTYPFTIFHNKIKDIEPIADPFLVRGRLTTIQWNQEGLGNSVRITYNDQKNDIQLVIAENASTSPGINTFDWVVDSSLVPTGTGEIKIRLQNLMENYGDSEIYTFSLAYISVLGDQKIVLLSPETSPADFSGVVGEQLEIGKSYRINWETQGEIKYVQLFLCDSLKNELKMIGEQTPVPAYVAKGFLDWVVDEFYGDKFYFLIKGGTDQNNITVEHSSLNSFRINRMPVLISPLPGDENVKLLPVLEMEQMQNAIAYKWDFENSDKQILKHASQLNNFVVPNMIDNELVPGQWYTIVASVFLGNINSYAKQFTIKAENIKPYPFSMFTPINGAVIEVASADADLANVLLTWERSVGALNYKLTIKQANGTIIDDFLIAGSETRYLLDISKYAYHEPILWELTALNNYGETVIQRSFEKAFITGIKDLSSTHGFTVMNYPNPFSTETIFDVVVPVGQSESRIAIQIFDMSGKVIAEVVDGTYDVGNYRFLWDGRNKRGELLPDGVYLCGFTTPKGRTIVKLIKI